YIEAANYKVRIHVGGDVHEVRETLANLEERLDPQSFARIHRGVIVNIDRIKELQPYFNGAYVVILENGTELKLSRRRRDTLEDLLGRTI
ncbi:MAG: LytTR family DNA-binding domain-containing protein, partial [Gemmatimonadota bacterium]